MENIPPSTVLDGAQHMGEGKIRKHKTDARTFFFSVLFLSRITSGSPLAPSACFYGWTTLFLLRTIKKSIIPPCLQHASPERDDLVLDCFPLFVSITLSICRIDMAVFTLIIIWIGPCVIQIIINVSRGKWSCLWLRLQIKMCFDFKFGKKIAQRVIKLIHWFWLSF